MPRYIEVVSATTETATKILAMRAGGSRRDIRITTNGGRTASVNWSDDRLMVDLNMPSLPPDAMLTRAEADRLVAFIGHECCHVLHSTRSVWDQAVAAGARVRDWTNALEDVRIEAREIAAGHFPALQGLLANMANHLHYESVVAARKHRAVIGSKVAQAPYVACILGRLANGYAMPAAAGLAAGMSTDVERLMTVALDGVRQCRGTGDVLYLAQQLVAMEAGMSPEAEPPQGNDKGQDEGQDGSEGQGDEGQGDEGQGDEGQGDEGQGDEGQGDEGQGDEGQGDEGQGDETLATDADLSATIDKIAERAGIADLNEHALTDASHALSITRCQVKDPLRGLATDASMNAQAAADLTARLPRNAVLHGQIGRMLVAAEVRRVTHHESSGRLDRRALVRMRTGATDVYSRRDDMPGTDTALMILLDGSSSMRSSGGYISGPTRMAIAQTAAWHIAKAAETAGAKVCIAVFHSRAGGIAAITIVKPWECACQDRAAVLGAVEPLGGTPMSPAILAASGMLANVSATRHILMVLTDGECDYGPAAVTRACVLAGDAGVEAVGVGIACASVIAAFPPRYSINVENLAQLAQAGLGTLVAMLEDANPRGAD